MLIKTEEINGFYAICSAVNNNSSSNAISFMDLSALPFEYKYDSWYSNKKSS